MWSSALRAIPALTPSQFRHCAKLWPILTGRRPLGDAQEQTMSHQPPKQSKKKPQHTPKEKKLLKQQKKHQGDTVPFIKH